MIKQAEGYLNQAINGFLLNDYLNCKLNNFYNNGCTGIDCGIGKNGNFVQTYSVQAALLQYAVNVNVSNAIWSRI
nr:hypothetical protein [Paenibacillus sp. sptzw28]